MGFSQGAATAFAYAHQHPEGVRGIASLVGYLPGNEADLPDGPAGVHVFMANGTEDERVPIDRARRDAARLRRLAVDLEYREYPVGHKLSADGVRDLRAWFLDRQVS